MNKKMTISEFRAFIQKEVIKLYVAHVISEGSSKKVSEDYGEKLDSGSCMEQPNVCLSKPENISDTPEEKNN